MERLKKYRVKLYMMVLTALLFCTLPALVAKAETATAISFGTINYDLLTLQVFNNNNTIVYYSTDNNTWTEVEGSYNSTAKSYSMDISWVPSLNDTTLYFKGSSVKTVKTITLPMKNSSFSVDYDKVDGSFTFNNAEEANYFEWRKSSDYYWRSVDIDENTNSYEAFMKTIEKFKVTGATIIIRLPQAIGTGADNVGLRQSAEDTVTIVARAAAPSIKVNVSKLTLNTSTVMEYYDVISDLWIECTSSMSLEEIAPEVLYDNGAADATIKIRKAATNSGPYSKTATVFISAQKAAPTIGDSSADVTYYFMNSKLILQFNKATSSNIYEYCIVKSNYDFNFSTASWKAVKASSLLTIASTTAPEGSKIYIRKAGTDAGTGSDAKAVLSSAISSFTVKY